MHAGDRQVLKFGGFVLDPAERRLSDHDRPVELSGKPLKLLELLTRRAPALVTREEIRAALWQDRVIEYDAAINAAIRDIRQALGDDPKNPRFVETVPRHGYRLIAAVTAGNAGDPIRHRAFMAVIFAASVLAALATWSSLTPNDPAFTAPAAAARQAFVKGEHLLASHDPHDALRAVAFLEQAVAADPGYAEAWAALADAHFYKPDRPGNAMPAVERAVRRALELAPDSARAHRRLADIRFVWQWQFDAAEAAFRRALEIAPGAAATHHSFAAFLIATDREDEAFAHMQRALAIDPLSIVLHGDLAWFYAMAGRHEEALQECGLLLELAPDNRRAIGCPMRSLIALGRFEEAARIARQLMPRSQVASRTAVQQLEDFWQWRLESGQEALAAGRFVSPMALAIYHARLGDPARAIEWIERARNERSRLFVYLRLFPEFRALHAHRRFIDAALPARQPTESAQLSR